MDLNYNKTMIGFKNGIRALKREQVRLFRMLFKGKTERLSRLWVMSMACNSKESKNSNKSESMYPIRETRGTCFKGESL